jgi:hypothetical protein
LNLCFIKGNVADNNSKLLRKLFHKFMGTVFANRGYWTGIREELEKQGVSLIPKPKKNQKGLDINPKQKKYAGKRGLIKTVFGMLTYQMDIDHTRHRSTHNAALNLVAGLERYNFLDKKPSTPILENKQFQQIVLF